MVQIFFNCFLMAQLCVVLGLSLPLKAGSMRRSLSFSHVPLSQRRIVTMDQSMVPTVVFPTHKRKSLRRSVSVRVPRRKRLSGIERDLYLMSPEQFTLFRKKAEFPDKYIGPKEFFYLNKKLGRPNPELVRKLRSHAARSQYRQGFEGLAGRGPIDIPSVESESPVEYSFGSRSNKGLVAGLSDWELDQRDIPTLTDLPQVSEMESFRVRPMIVPSRLHKDSRVYQAEIFDSEGGPNVGSSGSYGEMTDPGSQ